jgi:hypothetical protein
LGAQFGRVEFGDELAVGERVSFPGEDLFDSAAVAGGDMDLVGFDRAGNTRRSGFLSTGGRADRDEQEYREQQDRFLHWPQVSSAAGTVQ